MGKVFLVVVMVFALLFGRAYYCLPTQVAFTSPYRVQQDVVRQLSDKRKNCLCNERRIEYQIRNKDNSERTHIAYFNSAKKTLNIEIDPGSGWAFDWENVYEPLIEQVLKEGGQFNLFTKYRPNSSHLPFRQEHSF
ncbi:hypothetical protein [uncultured Fibrella sp.]|uniref:hypothetical protein n=1 Tax=uncultured Fibrella sp. TaxID=1284596 RepID=UPI0035CBD3C9